MTRSLSGCAHVARTDAPPIHGILDVVLDDERVPGTAGLRFRGLANVTPCERQARQDTANAVGLHGPPGFKSRILRCCSQALSQNICGQGLTNGTTEGCSSGCSYAHHSPRSASPIRSETPQTSDHCPKADAIIVAPATYNTINKWANGISDNYALGILAEAVGLRIPVVVLPFVNSALASHPAFERRWRAAWPASSGALAHRRGPKAGPEARPERRGEPIAALYVHHGRGQVEVARCSGPRQS